MDEIDLMDCPEPGCDGFMMRINLPSEAGRYRCVVCGLITWDTEEMQTITGQSMHTLTVDIGNWRAA